MYVIRRLKVNIALPSTLRFSKWFFPSGFCSKYLNALSVVCASLYCCHFHERSPNCEDSLVATPCLCLPVGTKFDTHRADLHDILSIFRKSVEEIQVSLKFDINKGVLYINTYVDLIAYRSLHLRMKSVSGESCRENQKTHFMFNTPHPPKRIVPFVR